MDPRLFGNDATAYVRAAGAAGRAPLRVYRKPRRRSRTTEL